MIKPRLIPQARVRLKPDACWFMNADHILDARRTGKAVFGLSIFRRWFIELFSIEIKQKYNFGCLIMDLEDVVECQVYDNVGSIGSIIFKKEIGKVTTFYTDFEEKFVEYVKGVADVLLSIGDRVLKIQEEHQSSKRTTLERHEFIVRRRGDKVVYDKINLDELRTIVREKREYRKDTGRRHRNHPVRGSWHYRRKNVNPCGDHEWEVVNEKPLRERCRTCGQTRWLVQSHRRGDPSLGIIDRITEVDPDDDIS